MHHVLQDSAKQILTAQVVRMIMEPFRSNEMLLNAFAEAGFSPNFSDNMTGL